jgi:hypothetical protein
MSSRRFGGLAFVSLALVAAGCDSLGYRSVDKATFERAKKGEESLDIRADELEAQAQVSRSLATARVDPAGRSLESDEVRELELNADQLARESAELEQAADLLREGKSLASKGLYYTVEPLVAFDSDLDATAIPALGVNWRPWDRTALAVQGVFGGAINPSSGGDDVGAALGLGMTHPVSEKGAISFGHIWWNESGDGDNGWYIGINLGDFTIER